MKYVVAAIAIVLGLSFTLEEKELTTLVIGDSAPLPTLALSGTDGNTYTLKDLKQRNGLLVIFSCNTCPFVIGNGENEGWEGRYNIVADAAEKSEIGMVLVNSNTAKRKNGDSMSDMIAEPKSRNW